MTGYLLRRLAAALSLALAVATAVFLLLRLVPGDVVTVMLGEADPAPEKVAAVRHALGLDRPLLWQYGHWLGRAVRGDFGEAFISGRPISPDLAARIPRSLELGGVALALAVLAGLPLGALSARHPGSRLDLAVGGIAVLGLTLPSFVIGMLFVLLFGLVLHWFPATGFVGFGEDPMGHLRHLVLPSVTLALTIMPVVMRMTRASMLEVLHQEYVRTARSKGLAEPVVLTRHVLRNSLIPVITVIGLQAGTLLGRIVLIEYIFNWPGLSSLLLTGVNQRDYPLVQAVVLVIALAFVLINLLVDVAYGMVDPRIRVAS
ncbi:MAG: ABC transporter permease [Armatimonadota bacterium]|nr:ABC transporter permease [Armatimonadota bacterium]